MYDVKVKSIREVDLSVLQFPQVAVFEHPDDYPDKAVGRVFDNGKPTNVVIVADTVQQIRENIRAYTNLVPFKRGHDDVPALVCVYL